MVPSSYRSRTSATPPDRPSGYKSPVPPPDPHPTRRLRYPDSRRSRRRCHHPTHTRHVAGDIPQATPSTSLAVPQPHTGRDTRGVGRRYRGVSPGHIPLATRTRVRRATNVSPPETPLCFYWQSALRAVDSRSGLYFHRGLDTFKSDCPVWYTRTSSTSIGGASADSNQSSYIYRTKRNRGTEHVLEPRTNAHTSTMNTPTTARPESTVRATGPRGERA